MDYKKIRKIIHELTDSRAVIRDILIGMGIDVTRSYHFKIREERTASGFIYQNGSCCDYGNGEYYYDIVSLLFDGYKCFQTLPETMMWLCDLLGIDYEVSV